MWWVEAMAADLVGAALNEDEALQQTPPVTWLAASAGLIDLCCTGMSEWRPRAGGGGGGGGLCLSCRPGVC